MRFDSRKSGKIIQVAMLLHNLIVVHREYKNNDDYDHEYFQNFSIDMQCSRQQEITAVTNEVPRALVTDNNERKPCGRPTAIESRYKEQGEILRSNLTLSLVRQGLSRPMEDGMLYNKDGHIFLNLLFFIIPRFLSINLNVLPHMPLGPVSQCLQSELFCIWRHCLIGC